MIRSLGTTYANLTINKLGRLEEEDPSIFEEVCDKKFYDMLFRWRTTERVLAAPSSSILFIAS
jgi:hypothetical protein